MAVPPEPHNRGGKILIWVFGSTPDNPVRCGFGSTGQAGQNGSVGSVRVQSKKVNSRTSGQRLRFGFVSWSDGSVQFDSVNRVNSAGQLGQPVYISTRRVEYCRMHASESHLGSDLTKS
ncbi:hypothetical protein HanRHA438_Chr11g0521741 [Helianthus annuus]|nr:hypothetical protein HanHA300_Chr11g0417761 [Helianthus annuus]KAJ0518825.1 hypothetical protein HanHA89_Chr11g0441771 [Helianthus annuus]KAJ0686845.1 hypothetical protein HanLR1_Chr11g0419311 [Helianthus annuus]KAJ0690652.1 hypothetical protein HanOQP8_Chr11g0420231 [Helianthus annuus]KAJ0872261.1 hypothetical protein HanRHA438_Chr11g0521741 [Helianthus annuus]